MKKTLITLRLIILSSIVLAQTPAPAIPPVATDITGEEIQAFLDNLSRNRVSDRPPFPNWGMLGH